MTAGTDGTIARQVAAFLAEQGVQWIFGVPGGENVILMEALRREGLQYILMHHEASAGFAASVTGQLAATPGVCIATLGPGAVNLAAGAACGTLERTPMLAITAEYDQPLQGSITHMQLDLAQLFGPVTKSSRSLSAENIHLELPSLWELAQRPPPGAVHVSISPQVAASAARADFRPSHDDVGPANSGLPAEALSGLQQAREPFVLVGLGAEIADLNASHIVQLAEHWNAPVAVTPKAKGRFPEAHALFAGCFSAYGDRALRAALERSDLILGIGLDGVDIVTGTWEIATRIVQLSENPAADTVFAPGIEIRGELADLVRQLAEMVRPVHKGVERAASIRARIRDDLRTDIPEKTGTIGLGPLIDALRAAMPLHGIVTVDVGAFKLVFLQQWQTDSPRTVLVANGLSAMGYAIPGALAARLCQPDTPVAAVVGDGALLMYAGELGTIARMGLRIAILVIVDEALALIRLKQLRQSVPVVGTEFGGTDYRRLAQSFGLDYARIDRARAGFRVLQQALASDRPTLVEARIDVAEYDRFK